MQPNLILESFSRVWFFEFKGVYYRMTCEGGRNPGGNDFGVIRVFICEKSGNWLVIDIDGSIADLHSFNAADHLIKILSK